jgi:hypothetical protein
VKNSYDRCSEQSAETCGKANARAAIREPAIHAPHLDERGADEAVGHLQEFRFAIVEVADLLVAAGEECLDGGDVGVGEGVAGFEV